MDYARFNYVAQPEDKGVALMPNIGIYDKYAISWGYTPILDKTSKEEKTIFKINQDWLRNAHISQSWRKHKGYVMLAI